MVLLATLTSCTTLSFSEIGSADDPERFVEKGTVSHEEEVWNPLWRLSSDARIEALLNDVEKRAREEYGSEATLGSIEVTGRWNLQSLLLGFGALGMVEDAAVTASVFLPAPPPPPVVVEEPSEPETITIVTFPIEPTDEIRDKYGYMRIEYLTHEQAVERVTSRLAKRGSDEETIAVAIEEVPAGGQILVHIGRQDLMHANTRWYRYLLSAAGVPLLERTGREGIPNVKGRDGNWWNVVELPVEAPIEDQVALSVGDTRAGMAYEYTIRRHERTVMLTNR